MGEKDRMIELSGINDPKVKRAEKDFMGGIRKIAKIIEAMLSYNLYLKSKNGTIQKKKLEKFYSDIVNLL